MTGPDAAGRLLVEQLRRDGRRDRRFSGNGVAAVPLQGSVPEGGAGVAVFRDNRVFVVGTLQPRAPGSPTRIIAARFLADGSVDPGFGRDGVAVAGPAGARADTLQLTHQGLLVIGGAVTGPAGETPLVLRLLPDGTPDATFGARGEVALPGAGRVRDVSVQRDLRVAAAIGIDPLAPGPDAMRVVRLTAAGAPDPAFAGTGIVDLPGSGAVGRGLGTAGVLLRTDGAVVVAGNSITPARAVVPVLARLRLDGTLDTAFGAGGYARLTTPGGFRMAALAADGRGRVLVAGRSRAPRAALVRLSARGRRDRGFGRLGLVRRTMGKIPGGGRRSRSEIEAVTARGARVVLAGVVADGKGRGYVMAARLRG
jgi:uncharacterized delta-60 repeat protein